VTRIVRDYNTDSKIPVRILEVLENKTISKLSIRENSRNFKLGSVGRIKFLYAISKCVRITQKNISGVTLCDQQNRILDIAFLGMGEDGHVASLFPPPETAPHTGVYVPVIASKPPPERITLTFPVLESAREAWVLVSGSGKEEALCDSIAPDGKTPLAHLIRQRPLTRVLTNI